mgnify:CR=1 FL=1
MRELPTIEDRKRRTNNQHTQKLNGNSGPKTEQRRDLYNLLITQVASDS